MCLDEGVALHRARQGESKTHLGSIDGIEWPYTETPNYADNGYLKVTQKPHHQ